MWLEYVWRVPRELHREENKPFPGPGTRMGSTHCPAAKSTCSARVARLPSSCRHKTLTSSNGLPDVAPRTPEVLHREASAVPEDVAQKHRKHCVDKHLAAASLPIPNVSFCVIVLPNTYQDIAEIGRNKQHVKPHILSIKRHTRYFLGCSLNTELIVS